MRFRSKIDSWILLLLIGAVAGQVVALWAAWPAGLSTVAKATVTALLVAGVLLVVSLLLRTHYTVSAGNLRIVSGPFAWTIAIADITAVEPSRNPLSSPALSLDRLKISHGAGKYILVSPADKDGFLKAIAGDAG